LFGEDEFSFAATASALSFPASIESSATEAWLVGSGFLMGVPGFVRDFEEGGWMTAISFILTARSELDGLVPTTVYLRNCSNFVIDHPANQTTKACSSSGDIDSSA
jgi:hypothetical protein